MYYVVKFKKKIIFFISLVLCAILSISLLNHYYDEKEALYTSGTNGETYIKWVNFNIPLSFIQEAINLDIESYSTDFHVSFIDLLAIVSTKYYGNFSKYNISDLFSVSEQLQKGQTPTEIVSNDKNFSYYYQSINAVLGGFVGAYESEVVENGVKVWKSQYGVKVFSPIAKGYSYSHYDDFGNSRSYGYKRIHLGHDLMGLTGTPIIAMESGVVEVAGWNQYGGWRIGIRSFDGTRYYYYAHLRQNRPFAEGLEVGKIVMAGDVIGYLGHTGYSIEENTNGVKQPHLHLGLQLIFDESQKDGTNQIWIDLYNITRLLSNYRSETVRDAETKEHTRKTGFREFVPEEHFTIKVE